MVDVTVHPPKLEHSWVLSNTLIPRGTGLGAAGIDQNLPNDYQDAIDKLNLSAHRAAIVGWTLDR